MSDSKPSLLPAILRAGLVIGVLDATSAMIHAYGLRGTTPDRIWKYVASGAFGKAANDGGPEMIVAGLVFHFFIATCWTGLFFVLAGKIGALRRHKVAAGVAYGLFVWIAMNYVVVPMSKIATSPLAFDKMTPLQVEATVLQIMIHLFVIGLPISLLANRYYADGKAA